MARPTAKKGATSASAGCDRGPTHPADLELLDNHDALSYPPALAEDALQRYRAAGSGFAREAAAVEAWLER